MREWRGRRPWIKKRRPSDARLDAMARDIVRAVDEGDPEWLDSVRVAETLNPTDRDYLLLKVIHASGERIESLP